MGEHEPGCETVFDMVPCHDDICMKSHILCHPVEKRTCAAPKGEEWKVACRAYFNVDDYGATEEQMAAAYEDWYAAYTQGRKDQRKEADAADTRLTYAMDDNINETVAYKNGYYKALRDLAAEIKEVGDG